MTFKVDKDIPAPTGRGNSKYPWAELGVGDSFLVPTDKLPPTGLNAMSAVARLALGKGNYRTALVDGGIRVWRTA